MQEDQPHSKRGPATRTKQKINLKDLKPEEIERLPRILPRGHIRPPQPAFNDPLVLMAWEYYNLRLRILLRKLENHAVQIKVINLELDLFHVDRDITRQIFHIQGLVESCAEVAWSRVEIEVNWLVRRALKVSQRILSRLRKKFSHLFPVYDVRFGEIDRDILLSVLSSDAMIDHFFTVPKIPSDQHSPKINKIILDLAPIYSRPTTTDRLQADAPLLAHGVLEPNLHHADPTSTWLDVSLSISTDFLESFHASSPDTQRLFHRFLRFQHFQRFSPRHGLSDVVLPDEIRRDIQALCKFHRASASKQGASKLVFIFKGVPGTGKTMTAEAIANELGCDLLRVNVSTIEIRSLQMLVRYLTVRARTSNTLLVFDECERMIRPNIFQGVSDGWVKILFEEFRGAAIFITNYAIPTGFDRRATYIVNFKRPDARTREQILHREIEHYAKAVALREVPQSQAVSKIAQLYDLPGGYYSQAIQLAVAHSGGNALTEESLESALERVERHSNLGHDHSARRPVIKLSDVELETTNRERLKNFVLYARSLLDKRPTTSRMPNGATAVFTGPPGTGKTLAAEAVAHELGLTIRRISPSAVLGRYVGESEQKIREIFRDAQEAGEVLFFDEAEGLFLDRLGSRYSWERTQVDELLQQVEVFKGVLIIATNHIEMIDAAFARRFLFHLHFDPPSTDIRIRLWAQWQAQLGLTDDDISALARHHELTGGEIRNVAARAVANRVRDLKCLLQMSEEVANERSGRMTKRIKIRS